MEGLPEDLRCLRCQHDQFDIRLVRPGPMGIGVAIEDYLLSDIEPYDGPFTAVICRKCAHVELFAAKEQSHWKTLVARWNRKSPGSEG